MLTTVRGHPLGNWGVRGGMAACDIKLGLDVKVKQPKPRGWPLTPEQVQKSGRLELRRAGYGNMSQTVTDNDPVCAVLHASYLFDRIKALP